MSNAATLPSPPRLRPFADPEAIRARAARVLRSPRRVTVSQAAERFRYLRNPGGGYTGPWHNDVVPYLVEPMDTLTSRKALAVGFVGPAQTGKTDALIINAIVHAVMVDPADMLVIQTSRDMARDFSKRRIARMNRDCEEVGRRLAPSKDGDNVFDKTYTGMMLSLGSPTIGDLSGRPIPRVLLTDYDRMTEDVDGEGSPFDLARKRTTTFGSRAYTLAESSPGRPVLKANWKPPETAPHMAPPSTGILALYNRGDRRRWHWPCPHCGEYFEGGFDRLDWPKDLPADLAAERVTMICPHNGCVIEPKHRSAMNAAGRWVIEGQEILADGTVIGEARRSDIATFWMKGPAAAFITWGQLVKKYLDALAEFEATGSEEALKTTINTDQAEPYTPQAGMHEESVDAAELAGRAEAFPLRVVPQGVAFLVAAVDVQANRFDVLVRGFGPHLESWTVDWFSLFKAGEGDKERPVDPANFSEDWDQLLEHVLQRAYPLAGDEARRKMAPVLMVIDSGGAKGVTGQAYDFLRRASQRGLAGRVRLSKGAAQKGAPRVYMTYPDSRRKDRKAGARGEIPVWFFNPNMLKDELDGHLRRTEPGGPRVHFSRDLLADQPPHPFFEQVTAEVRQADGTWIKDKARNEALDLMVMAHVGALSLKADRIVWDSPPDWAGPWDGNPMVRTLEGDALPVPEPQAAPRRRRVRSRGLT